MPALPPQRAPLCLFCAFRAAARPRPQRILLSHVQVAHRTGGPAFKITRDRAPESRPSSRPLDSSRPNITRTFAPRTVSKKINGIVSEVMEQLRLEFIQPEWIKGLWPTREAFDAEWLAFERSVSMWLKRASPEVADLGAGYGDPSHRVKKRLRYLFYAQAFGGRFTQAELANQKEVADLRFPTEWYPATREIPRTVHLHVGPTNSGKTYQALKRLEEAESGIYLGPLRLLAHEVYTRLNAKGKPCALVTGEELRVPEGDHSMWSCTVEMAPLNQRMDVAVIDEIQMINHEDRGWAWTQAFLGIQAKEIHLCGEARTVPLIRELCAIVGDKVHVHEYERLSPLRVAGRSLGGKIHLMEKGDCMVVFSVLGIHALRREIESKTGKKCAIVYGSLPPETRAAQARLFNDPDNDYDFLVASDAIGMGLNLAIKRVIFESISKSNGTHLVPLKISEIKQIAGRAGRFKTAHQAIKEDNAERSATQAAADPPIGLEDTPKAKPEDATVGYVTTLSHFELGELRRNMGREAEVIKTAGLFPPSQIVERFANYFPPGTPFSYILLRLHEISILHPRFHLCELKDQLAIADAIHTVRNLSIQDRIMLCAAPMNTRDEQEKAFMKELAQCIADNKSGDLLDLTGLPLEILDLAPSAERKYLKSLELLHKMMVLYLWLSFRFPNVFTSRKLANHVTKMTEEAIEKTLSQFSFTEHAQESMRKARMKVVQEMKQQSADTEASSQIEATASMATTDDMSEAVRDMLVDKSSYSGDEEAPRDDELEYPSPELEELENEEERTVERNELASPLSPKNSTERQTPLHLDLKNDPSDAPQPRL